MRNTSSNSKKSIKNKWKRKEDGIYPPDPKILREISKRENIAKGVAALDSIWKQGILPNDLTGHYFITWLAYVNGNTVRFAKLTGLNRNTVIVTFLNGLRQPSTFKLRGLWFRVKERNKGKTFQDQVRIFYEKVVSKPRLQNNESRALVCLWLMGVPRKVIRAHYVFWSLRQGRGLMEIGIRLGKDLRSIHRYRVYGSKQGSLANKWLILMGINKSDWQPRKRGRPLST
jgi:hypothetical protein